MAVINMRDQRFEYYDALPTDDHSFEQNVFRVLRKWLCEESLDKRHEELNLDGWTDYAPMNIPHQKNGYDCGVFALMYAQSVSLGLDLETHPFGQEHMLMFRRRMMVALMRLEVVLGGATQASPVKEAAEADPKADPKAAEVEAVAEQLLAKAAAADGAIAEAAVEADPKAAAVEAVAGQLLAKAEAAAADGAIAEAPAAKGAPVTHQLKRIRQAGETTAAKKALKKAAQAAKGAPVIQQLKRTRQAGGPTAANGAAPAAKKAAQAAKGASTAKKAAKSIKAVPKQVTHQPGGTMQALPVKEARVREAKRYFFSK